MKVVRLILKHALFVASGIMIFIMVMLGIMNCPKTNNPLKEINYILVEKAKRTLSVYSNGEMIKSYKIALGFSPIGKKEKEGDGKTPEGKYYIIAKNPKSAYHLSLKISYPSHEDIRNAKSCGFKPGGDIMIHGLTNGLGWIGKAHIKKDWTLGCIAVTNEEIEEIYHATPIGTVVEIKP